MSKKSKFHKRRPRDKTLYKVITYAMLTASRFWFLYFNKDKRTVLKMIRYLYKRIGCRVVGMREQDLRLNYDRAKRLTSIGQL